MRNPNRWALHWAGLTLSLIGLMSWSTLPSYSWNRLTPPAFSLTSSTCAGRPAREITQTAGPPPALCEANQPAKMRVSEAYGRLPLSFEANRGQSRASVKFLSRGDGYSLCLTSTEAVLTRPRANQSGQRNSASSSLRMRLIGASPSPQIEGLDPLPGKSHYLIGNDPSRWRTDIPTYARVRYREVYPGVDLIYYGNRRQLESDWVVAPGADPRAIRLAFEGVTRMRIDAMGDLVLRTAGGEVRQHKPVIYQEGQDGSEGRQVIAGRYVRRGRRQIGFQIAAYDASKPLVIDPVLSYSTYLGGGGGANSPKIAVDAVGNAYLTGAAGPNFPTTAGAFQTTFGGGQFFTDAFVMKLNAAGTAVIYSTYLGGSMRDIGTGIAVDASGNAYVTGTTNSANFPVTPGAVQSALSGGIADSFIAKLNATGTALIYSTYLGGSGGDLSTGIAVDAAGNAYLTGATSSTDFPTTLGVVQPAFGGGTVLGGDIFVTKLNAAGTALVYSTYLGGSGDDRGLGIAVDAGGNAYVTGDTGSGNFPTTAGAFQTMTSGGGFTDAVVAKLNAVGTALVYSTYLGGDSIDQGNGIAVDAAGNAYVVGLTVSLNFPTTPGAFDTTCSGCQIIGSSGSSLILSADSFVTKLNPTGTALVYSTFLGGSGDERSSGIAVDAAGSAYVTGGTFSKDFPATPNAIQTQVGGSDAFVTKLNPAGTALVYSTYLGGGSSDLGSGIAVDAAGNAYVSGNTLSTDFPTTPGAFKPTFAGGGDGFIAKISADDQFTLASVSAASYAGSTLAIDSLVATFGANLATATVAASTLPLPTSLAGTSVKVKDSAGTERLAPLLFVSPGQINYQLPPETVTGTATVTVSSGNVNIATGTVQIALFAPGVFTADASGQGAAAALALRVKADGSQTYESVVRFDPAQNKFIPIPIDLGPEADRVFLVLFGTGIRHANLPLGSILPPVRVTIGGESAQVFYAGAQGDFVGLDQINVLVPRTLVGRGEVDVVLTAISQTANPVRVSVR